MPRTIKPPKKKAPAKSLPPLRPPLRKSAEKLKENREEKPQEIVVDPNAVDWIDGQDFKTPEDAQLFIKKVEANSKLLSYKRQRKEVVDTRFVIEAANEISVMQADMLNALIDRMSPELAALTDPLMVRKYLQEKFYNFFANLQQAWLSRTA